MDRRMTPVVSLRGAQVAHQGRTVVHAIDLDIPRGSWFGLVGANGSGKTSLLKALAGRLPFSGGACLIDGRDMIADRAGRAEQFGFAPPADRLPDSLRGCEMLAFVGGNLDRVHRNLGPLRQALGLDKLLDQWIGNCSAGMKQRLALAAAFAGGQKLVILDEPFNWLDPVAIFDLRLALRQMVDDGLTLITALHDLNALVVACDGGLILSHGKKRIDLSRGMLRDAAASPSLFEKEMIDILRTGAAE
ncbi:ATP-binding cassette domain-containing protein [Gluconacetobacter sp. Hr-1-5]|uniref:ATP-binding cassette domain-containing protein n=1 Tax=Gluconacetobacter sp. Hr-1-5 TaxID=3395370 RepID=UPI003B51C1A4